jgi:hypothetical protein
MTIAVWAQTLVLAFTAFLIWRYTRASEKNTDETTKLRAETVRQNKLSLRPIILPEFTDDDIPGSFRLRNCGNGSAINVQVMPVGTARYEGFGVIESRFNALEYLPSGDTATVASHTYADGEPLVRSPFEEWFHPRLPAAEDTTIELRFADVEGGKYSLRVTILAEQDLNNLPRTVRLGAIEELP